MRAISLYPPWAHLIAYGGKSYETRSWSTSYRGPVAIHATKNVPPVAVKFCREAPEESKARLAHWYGDRWWERPQEALPCGVVLCVAWIADCEPADEVAALLERVIEEAEDRGDPAVAARTRSELAAGGYGPGRFAWELRDPILVPPIPVKGRQGFWILDDELLPPAVLAASRHPA